MDERGGRNNCLHAEPLQLSYTQRIKIMQKSYHNFLIHSQHHKVVPGITLLTRHVGSGGGWSMVLEKEHVDQGYVRGQPQRSFDLRGSIDLAERVLLRGAIVNRTEYC